MLMEKPTATPKAQLATHNQTSALAGNYSGRRVLCENAQVLTAFTQLRTLALQGNHWARISINGIQGLAAGRLHQNNIFVRKDAPLANGRGRFFMILPGIRATFEDLANGTFLLVGLSVDGNYSELQRKNKKPGIYKVAPNAVEADLKLNGNIEKENQRVVVVADKSPELPLAVAAQTIEYAAGYHDQAKKNINRKGFDLHYTPGQKGIVGLKSTRDMLKHADDPTLAESATLLANAMYNARNIEDVIWMSSLGGSAILTKALEILSQSGNVKLNGHSLYLHHPTSNSQTAFQYAAKLDIEDTKQKTSAFAVSELRGNHLPNLFTKNSLKTLGLNGVDAVGSAASIGGAFIDPSIGAALGIATGSLYFVRKAMTMKKNSVPSKY